MNVLHLDLTKNATRQALLDDLLDRLSAEEVAEVLSVVAYAGSSDTHHHDLAAAHAAIDNLPVSESVKRNAQEIYRILAQAEAKVHGCTVETTHFHEVGKDETVREVSAICMALELLSPAIITATPVQTGSGTVECAHGVLDIPAPATAAIIERGIPVCAEKLQGELCTPTSAAVILHFVDEFVIRTRETTYTVEPVHRHEPKFKEDHPVSWI